MFFRKSRLEALPVTMTGVRMGERLLQVGLDDPGLAGTLASKVGLSGVAAHVVRDDQEAARAQRAAAAAGVLVDVQRAALRTLPVPAESFDLVVVHARGGWLGAMPPADRVAFLQQVHRSLRQGGRVVVIESTPRAGLARLLRRDSVDEHYDRGGGARGALTAEGFRPVRVLGEREGYRFTEGLKA